MKELIVHLVKLSVLINVITCIKPTLFPNLPMGEFKIFYKAILQCEPRITTNGFQFNWYISKMSANTTVIKGNATTDVPLDDSYTFHTNWAIRDSIGGWKDNALVYTALKACTNFKHLMGDSWIPFMSGLGIYNYNCTITPGVYLIPSGLDTSIIYNDETNWPKVFYYGLYKAKIFIKKNNQVMGCIIFVMDVKRLWETE